MNFEGDLRQVIRLVTCSLMELSIAHHITGGLASSYWGEPRLTQDIDFVIRLEPHSANGLLQRLDHNFLVEPTRITKALRQPNMFQALPENSNQG